MGYLEGFWSDIAAPRICRLVMGIRKDRGLSAPARIRGSGISVLEVALAPRLQLNPSKYEVAIGCPALRDQSIWSLAPPPHPARAPEPETFRRLLAAPGSVDPGAQNPAQENPDPCQGRTYTNCVCRCVGSARSALTALARHPRKKNTGQELDASMGTADCPCSDSTRATG